MKQGDTVEAGADHLAAARWSDIDDDTEDLVRPVIDDAGEKR